MYPGLRVYKDQDRPRIFYGMPMTMGATPEDAAELWLESHSEAFGAGALELRQLWASPVMLGEEWGGGQQIGQGDGGPAGKFTAFGYQQFIDGLPVEYGNVRLLVLNEPVPRVVFAAATVAPPLGPLQARINLEGELAVQLVQSMPLFRGLKEWGQPELAIYQGDGEWTAPSLVWKFVGENPELAAMESKTFFVDTATGRLVHVRNEIYHNDVTGTVKGWASPGTLPDAPYNPPTLQNIPEMRVRIEGGPNSFTTRDGLFAFSNAGSTLINIGTGVGVAQSFGGRWVNVVPNGVAAVSQTLQVTPPGQVHFVLNTGPSEQMTAQVNVFIGTILTHNYFKDRAPTFTALDTAIRANTGVSGSCNAFFRATDPSINFYNAGGGCPNSGYSSVIAHEYGHFIVNRLNLGQGGFGEGYSDVIAMLLYDDGVVGRGFTGQNSVLRNPIAANVQYPCPTSQGIHYCGQIVGGVWWRMRNNFGSAYGASQGLAMVRDLQVAWSLQTVGGTGSSNRNSAHPGTAIEVLVLDDDDGNLGNGTPNWQHICSAFNAHSIDCPELTLFTLELPNGAPALVTPGQPTQIEVRAIPVTASPISGTESLVYRLPGGSFISTPMVEIATHQYLATLPAVDCGESIEYYFTAMGPNSQVVVYPTGGAPAALVTRALQGTVETIVADFDFETPADWTVWNHPSLTTGQWERVIPVGTVYNNQQVQTGAAFSGQRCYVTQNGPPNAGVGDFDVDGGPTILTSPLIDISGADVAELEYAYWHYTINGTPDFLEVDVSPDNGSSWTRIATYGNTAGWRKAQINILDYIPATATMRIRFSVSDNPNNSLTESAIDDVRVTIWQCQAACYANCDGSTQEPILNVDDFTCFINRFAANDPWANCDGSTQEPILNVDDFTCFINAFAQGCP